MYVYAYDTDEHENTYHTYYSELDKVKREEENNN